MTAVDPLLADTRPILALTLGDVAGIGPEVSVAAAAAPQTLRICRPVLVGDPEVVRRAAQQLRLPQAIDVVDGPVPSADPDRIACWSPRSTVGVRGRIELPRDLADVPPGRIDGRAGQAAYGWLVAAARAALDGQIGGIVTAPLNKKALEAAGLDYPGHTEILADECGVRDFAMMLYVPPGHGIGGPAGLGVAHVTLHTSLRSVPGLLSMERVFETIGLIDRFLRRAGCASPRIGVCALNPHAGESGRFGDEEARLIAPAVERARADSLDARGPIPADALLRQAVGGEFDGVAAMYHDQGHIALKLVAFNRAVNVTLGLPIVRTSPSHGTAFDIAGQGQADAGGMRAAIETAVRLIGATR
ncbi:MAG: 4-hydroxythreonine-4-phosphate dehydrogenase PdxA [Planctomyces sp.]|nr:4-hydroxythreonine-4-phosphate dehydrogenase PdxA [Planctomyces sp.]